MPGMELLAYTIAALSLGLTGVAVTRATVAVGLLHGTLQALLEVVKARSEEDEASVRKELRDLEDLVDRLPGRWEEIKREAARLDGRARYAVGRARKELEERGLTDERLEDLGRELRLVDGEGGELVGLPPMPTEVAEDQAVVGDWRSEARAALMARRMR